MNKELSYYCEKGMELYRIWENSEDDEDKLRLLEHQRNCDKCRKPEDNKNARDLYEENHV